MKNSEWIEKEKDSLADKKKKRKRIKSETKSKNSLERRKMRTGYLMYFFMIKFILKRLLILDKCA